jgi:hypothetical protein
MHIAHTELATMARAMSTGAQAQVLMPVVFVREQKCDGGSDCNSVPVTM